MIIGGLRPAFTPQLKACLTAATATGGDSVNLTDGREAARAVLAGAGRNDVKRDLRWLEKHFGRSSDLADLARFYGLAQSMYAPDNKERMELIRCSLKSIRGFLDEGCVVTHYEHGKAPWSEEVLHMTRDERVETMQILLRAIPPEKSSYVLQSSRAIDMLKVMRQAIEQKKNDVQSSYSLGASMYDERFLRMEPISGPKPTIVEAARDYAHYMDIIRHAEGRRSEKLDWSDDTSSVHAVGIAYNAFNRDTEKVARFSRVLGVVQNPWTAHAVVADLNWVPAARREEAETDVLGHIRERRKTNGSPQNHLDTIGEPLYEGTAINRLSRVTSWSYALQRSGQSREDAKMEAEKTLGVIHTFTTWYQDKAFALCLLGQDDGEPLDSVAKDLVMLVKQLQPMGHLTESSMHIFELLGRMPQFGHDRKACLEAFLQQRATLPKDCDPLLVEESLEKSDDLAAEMRQLTDQVALTGKIDGLDRLRDRVKEDLKSNILVGNEDELMKMLELKIRLQPSSLSKDERVARAYASLTEARSRELTVQVEPDRVVVGGIALPRRSAH